MTITEKNGLVVSAVVGEDRLRRLTMKSVRIDMVSISESRISRVRSAVEQER